MNGYRSIFNRTTLSKHSIRRMKQRADLKNKKRRNKFVRNVTRNGICLKDIPRHPKFKSIFHYMKHMCKKAHDKSPFCKVYLYKDFIVPISVDGVIITCFKINKDYTNSFYEITEYKNRLKEYSNIEEKYHELV